jgi:outer membrane protein assembly factor BamE (lipoprotein component of BamABCDE complex)
MKVRTLSLEVALLFVIVGGCISIKNEESYGKLGPIPNNKTLAQVKKGETKEEWVKTTLGKPVRESKSNEKQKLLIYEYNRQKEGRFNMPFFSTRDEKEERQRLVFKVSDGIVQDWWIER